MVARDDHHRPVAERLAEPGEHRLGCGEHLADGPVAQLECVAEQHETVNAVERADQLIEYPFAPQNIGTRPITDVQIGDDERACQSARS
jgi:hypothetical protein